MYDDEEYDEYDEDEYSPNDDWGWYYGCADPDCPTCYPTDEEL
jgi:hypothetical protein